MSNPSGEHFTAVHAKLLYISFLTYTFDILFFISSSFVIPYLSKQIYPAVNVGVSLTVTWAGFATGAFLRPIGAGVFGPRADRIGRKRALYIALIGGSLSTALIGAVPTYKQVGLLSLALYVILEMISGFFVGALVAAGLTYGPENFPERLRGFLTGFSESGGSLAHTIGALWLALIASLVTGAAFISYGWRFMYLVAIVPLVLILPVLYTTPESEIFELSSKRETKPVKARELVTDPNLRRVFFVIMFMAIGILGIDNLLVNQLPTYLRLINHFSPGLISYVVLVVSLGGIVGSWIGGAFSQRTGRKVAYAIGTGIFLVLAFLYLPTGSMKASAAATIMGIFALMYFFDGIGKASLSLYLNESFRTLRRASAVGLIWNIGYGVAAIWPIAISSLLALYGLKAYPDLLAAFVFSLAVVGTISMTLSREPKGNIEKEKQELLKQQK